MENNKCNSHNGTYACAHPAGHAGAHQVTHYRRNSRNVIIFYVTSNWSDAYGPVKQTKGFA